MEEKGDSIVALIRHCATLKALKSVHAFILRSHHPHLSSTNILLLIPRYISLGSIPYACALSSSSLPSSHVFLWNIIIRAFSTTPHPRHSLRLYSRMLQLGLRPTGFTFPFLLKACGFLSDFDLGARAHAHAVVFGYESDVFVANSLVAMYGRFGRLGLSRQVFDGMTERNVVSWSSMVGACAANGCHEEGLSLFRRMLGDEGIAPNRGLIVNAMACVHMEHDADDICGVVMGNGLDSDQAVQNAAMGMYARCGRIDVARRFFDGIIDKDLVAWTSMIEAYAQADLPTKALELFQQMKLQGIVPDSVTLLGLIHAVSNSASFQLARLVHGVITRTFFKNHIALNTAVIDLYVKCGNLEYARKFFDRMSVRNLISWSTMISGYGMHGYAREALRLFDQMKASSIKPDQVTFVSVLSACSHGGLVAEGWECFNAMSRDFGVTPRTEHYACMVDLLGRAGQLTEAQAFIQRMPITPDAGVWGALLGACRIHSNSEIAETAARHLFDLDAENSGRYILLSNIYASSGKRKEADDVRALMKSRRVRKTIGQTIIEIKNKVYTFVSGDTSNPQTELIYSELRKLMDRIQEAGYVPDLTFVLHDTVEETKEEMLYAHSEKLAIVFGLLNSGPESVIRIRKNLRVCGDCHNATKFISAVTEREIVMRDARRFHHFKAGSCSCGDYW